MLSAEYLGMIWQGYQVTVGLSVSSCIAATILGVVLCGMRICSVTPLRMFARGYIAVFRNTPLIVQLFFWYNGVSGQLPPAVKAWLLTRHEWIFGPVSLGWPSIEFVFGFIGLTFYTAAYIAEEIRAGVQTVPENQKIAAYALGFKPIQTFVVIILPQAVRNALSPLFGQYMNALKNSSLTAAIGVAEMFYVAGQVDSKALLTFQVYLAITVVYIATIALIEVVVHLIQEHRISRTGRRLAV